MTSTDLPNQILTVARASLSARTRWDEMPELLVFKRHSDTGVSVQPLPIPDLLWELFHPAEVIVASARATRTTTIAAEADTVALALRSEGFAITPDTSPQAAEAMRRRMAGGSAPRNEDIPGRIEQRWINAVDRHGQQYLVTADRLSDGSAAPAVGHALDDSERLGGAIHEALEVFCQTVWPCSAAAAAPHRLGEPQ
ncbi:hypothetical protein [Streptomyces sp. R35]|uniref:ESAT-6 protein secretion system EspG family protein n=1 Tax=Streptomyces sp. R35 TaxID=3238630 RepID=A0AB39S430_9ACTN